MKTILPSPFIVPVGFHELLVLPFATPRIVPGAYNYRLSGRADTEDMSTPQFFLKPVFNLPGAPTLTESRLISHFRFGLSRDGSDAVQTAVPPIEIGSINSIPVKRGHFQWIGEIVVSEAGYNSLAFLGEVEAGKPVTIEEAVIELWQ